MRDHLKKNCFSDRVLWHVKTHALEFKTWAPAGGSKSRRSLLPGKPPKKFVHYMGGLFTTFSPYGGLFSTCGGLFATFFFMWGPFLSLWGTFLSLWGTFLGLPHPLTKTSAGAHHSKACLQNLF